MKRFVEGTDRGQRTLFPETLDDWVGEENAVRVIDILVGSSISSLMSLILQSLVLTASIRRRRGDLRTIRLFC